MAVLNDLVGTFETLWPPALAETWDAPGLVTGSSTAQIRKALLTVDLTHEVLEQAIQDGVDLVLAHHPYLMRGVNTMSESTVKGSVISDAIRNGISIYSAHTNADSAVNGVSEVFAKALGILDPKPLIANSDGVGLGRYGQLAASVTLGELATRLAKVLPPTASGIRVAGDYRQQVRSVGLCGGAGDSLLPEAQQVGLDVFITADLRHHVVQDAREARFVGKDTAIIDVSHWASEWLWLEQAAQDLRKLHSDVVFEVCDLRTDPWDFVVTQ